MNLRLITFLLCLCCGNVLFAQRMNIPLLADQYYKNAEFDKAAELYDKLFSQTGNLDFYNRLLDCELQLKEYDKAIKIVKKQLKRNPNDIARLIDLGKVYKETGQAEQSRKTYEEAISKVGKSGNFQVGPIADAFLAINEVDYAIATYQKARKSYGDPFIFSDELIQLYHLKNDDNAVLEELLGFLDREEAYSDLVKSKLSDNLSEDKGLDLLKSKLLDRLQAHPQNAAYYDLLIWLFVQQKQFELALNQAIALDKRTKGIGRGVMELAPYAISNHEYASAIKAYDYIVQKGKENPYYINALQLKLQARYAQVIEEDIDRLEIDRLLLDYQLFSNQYGENAQQLQEEARLYAYYTDSLLKAENLLEKAVKMGGQSSQQQARCKLDLGDVYLLNNQPWDAILLYGQVEKDFKDDPLGQEAKFRSAKLSYYQGEFDWAKAQLDVLKGSTSQLFANDALNLSLLIADNTGLDTTTTALKMYAAAGLLIFRNQFAAAEQKMDSINQLFPKHSLADEILMARAEIASKKRNYEAAINLYKQVLADYPEEIWADDALFNMAELTQKRLHKEAEAKELYQRIITDYTGSLYVNEARKRFRKLRGDTLN